MEPKYINICNLACSLLRKNNNLQIEMYDLNYTNETKFPNSLEYLEFLGKLPPGDPLREGSKYNAIKILLPLNYFSDCQMGIDTTLGLHNLQDRPLKCAVRIAHEIFNSYILKDEIDEREILWDPRAA